MAAFRYPWQAEPVPVALSPLPDPEEPPRKRRGRRAASIIPAAAAAATPNWLYYHLTISGPAETVAAFAVAARGSGVVPWQLDFTALEEEVFVRAVAQPASRRNLTIDGCRILARQFRERVEARQARAAALVGRSDACPFDLHTLLPVPAAILQLGPTHPDARMLADDAMGHHRSAAAGGRAAETENRATEDAREGAAVEVPRDGRLWVFHRWRDAAPRHGPPRRTLAGAAFFPRAASGRLTDAGHEHQHRGGR